MCTVSYIPLQGKCIITSNRDENALRPSAFVPKEEIINGCRVVYPKDPKAGGTWFAVNQNGTVAVLLNGAFEKHVPRAYYATSRGLVLLSIISNPAPVFYFQKTALDEIEPFTVIVFEDGKLCELRWDAATKHMKQLDPLQNHIWSSATLYSKEAVAKREVLFEKFTSPANNMNAASIIQFHSSNFDDAENGFVINRNNCMVTFSITQATITSTNILLAHHDLRAGKNYETLIEKENLPEFN